MPYDPRTLAFISEILHPPVQHDAAKLQELHGQLFSNSEIRYANFALIPGGATLSNPPQQANQIATASFLPDRIQIREELTPLTLEEFSRRVVYLAELASASLGVQVFTAQQVIVRSVIQPRHYRDSREFLASGICSLSEENFAPIGRPAQLFGLRAIYPQTPTDNNVYALRIESFNNDLRSVFVEVVATFPPLVAGGAAGGGSASAETSAAQLGENVGTSYTFLVDRALAFVEQFDQPRD